MVSKHCSIIRKHAKFEPDRTNRTGVMTKNVRSVRRKKKKERRRRKKERTQVKTMVYRVACGARNTGVPIQLYLDLAFDIS